MKLLTIEEILELDTEDGGAEMFTKEGIRRQYDEGMKIGGFITVFYVLPGSFEPNADETNFNFKIRVAHFNASGDPVSGEDMKLALDLDKDEDVGE